MNGLDIASFAEDLLDKEVAKGKPVQFAAAEQPNAPDVSDIEVPEDFAHQVLTEGLWGKANVEVSPLPKPQRVDEKALYKRQLLKDYEHKVGELEDLISEMTSVGMIGVGVGAGPVAPGLSVSKKIKKKKRRYVRTNRFNR